VQECSVPNAKTVRVAPLEAKGATNALFCCAFVGAFFVYKAQK